MDTSLSDPFNLARFPDAQSSIYTMALSGLRAGQKRSHWMWFLFPQVEGLGSSSVAKHYAIRSSAEAKDYLEHPVLGKRLKECVDALPAVEGRSARQIMGDPDYLKLQSSMTLFSTISPSERRFSSLLEKYYAGNLDQRTVGFLRNPGASD